MNVIGNILGIRPSEFEGVLRDNRIIKKCEGPVSAGQRSILFRLGLPKKVVDMVPDSEKASQYITSELRRLATAIKNTGYSLSPKDSQSAENLLRAMEYSPLTLDQFNTARTSYP